MNNQSKNVAVIGAGPMGLAVAYQLVELGFQPTIFEGDDRIGGQAASFDFNGTKIERYYHFHCTSDEDFFEVLRELHIEDKLQWKSTKMGYFFENALYAWGNPIALLTFPKLDFISKMRYGLHAFYSTKIKNWKHLDSLEATQWIKKWIGEKAFDILWKKLFDLKFYHYANQLSAAWIWSRIRRVGRSRYDLFREKLGYLEGGSDTLLYTMKAHIEAKGGKFELSTAVQQVVIENNQVAGIQTKKGFTAFDTVISTVPTPYIELIMPQLPNELLEKYRAIKNIAVVCVVAKLKKPVSHNFWINVNIDTMDIPGIIEYTNLRPMGDCHIVYAPFYMPGEHPKYQEGDAIFANKLKSYIKAINPALSNADFLDIKVSRYRHAQPICEPNHLEKIPPIKTVVRGLFIADTSYYYPEDRGISESIQLGRKIAKMV